jgi:hypothetical protein
MYLSENMELLETLVARGAPAPWPPGGKGGQGAGGAKNLRKKIKVMDSGVSHQVKQGDDKPRSGSALHSPTVLQPDLLQRS